MTTLIMYFVRDGSMHEVVQLLLLALGLALPWAGDGAHQLLLVVLLEFLAGCGSRSSRDRSSTLSNGRQEMTSCYAVVLRRSWAHIGVANSNFF